MPENRLTTNCCICGGGPAGMMLGFLLARAGIDVIVLEKHKDFFRDFRGDTIHPSTIALIDELNLLDEFLQVPHQDIKSFTAIYNGIEVGMADFTKLKIKTPVLQLMPQWDFLNFLEKKASAYKGFRLIKEAFVTDLIHNEDRVNGVFAQTPIGSLEIRANIVIGTDGRSSTVRRKANLTVIATGAPIDVLWFRLSRTENDPKQVLGRFDKGRILVQLDRGEYWQCAYVIAKGDFDRIKQEGIVKFRQEINEVAPFISNRTSELQTWDDIKLLSVAIDHLERWYTDGLLCIGDAAHAMSPIGGVGINLAIQDAVAAANILYPHLLRKEFISIKILKKVQKRRAFPSRFIQRLQVAIQKGIITRKTNERKQKSLPLPFRILKTFPYLRRIPARILGIGIRPEHIHTPDCNF